MLPTFTESDVDMSNMHYVLFPESRYNRIGLTVYNTKCAFVESIYEKITASPETMVLFTSNLKIHNIIYENGDSILYQTN